MTIEPLCESIRADFEEVCEAFRGTVLRLGLSEGDVPLAACGACRIDRVRDDYDKEDCMIATWSHADGVQFAHIVRYANGNMFAEHDVLLPHPDKSDLFIEAVEVWGHAGQLKSEVRLLPAL